MRVLVACEESQEVCKAAEPYGRAIEEEIALARSLRRSFEARAKKERIENEGASSI